MQKPFFKKLLFSLLLLTISGIFQFCKSSNQTVTYKKIEKPKKFITYTQYIKPIMVQKCTPCHFPDRGRKEMLDTYLKSKKHITEILKRIQLPTNDKEFMPFKSKRAPLTKEEIQLFTDWYKTNMAE